MAPTSARSSPTSPTAGLVEAVPNYGPNHGFNAFLAGPPSGLHNVCAFALNQGAGTHSLLGCKQG